MKIRNIGHILMGVSALAVIAALPAHAETGKTSATSAYEAQAGSSEQKVNPRGPSVTQQDIERGWDNTKKAVSDTAKDVSNAVEKAAEDVRAVLIDEDQKGTTFNHASYGHKSTANGLIDSKVKDAQGKDVATIHDVILDKDGEAELLILSDGGFLGVGGKKVALDYDTVVDSSNNAETLRPISKDLVKNVSAFSYEPDSSSNTITKSADALSLRELVGSNLVDSNGKTLAKVKNISLEDGDADRVIVAFDQTLGLGGDLASLEFDDANIVQGKDGKAQFQLSAAQAQTFENYKRSIKSQ